MSVCERWLAPTDIGQRSRAVQTNWDGKCLRFVDAVAGWIATSIYLTPIPSLFLSHTAILCVYIDRDYMMIYHILCTRVVVVYTRFNMYMYIFSN